MRDERARIESDAVSGAGGLRSAGGGEPVGRAPRAVECLADDRNVTPDPEAIERALTGAWKSAVDRTRGADGAVVTRSCMGTLVVCEAPDVERAQVEDILRPLMTRFPSRVIVVDLTSEAGEAFSATYSAFCQRPASGGRQVCCEQVRFRAGRGAFDLVAPSVLGLLVSDMPVTVWWPGRPFADGGALQHVYDAADRLVVDSRAFALAPHARELRDAASGEHGRRLVDLNWLRLLPWRLLIAEIFDGAAARGDLARLARVEICAGSSTAEPPSAAMLLAGWLTSRLRWRGTSARAPLAVRLTRSGEAPGEVELTFRLHEEHAGGECRSAESAGDGALHMIRLIASGGGPTYQVERKDDGVTLVASVIVAGTCPLPRLTRAPVRSIGDVLASALKPSRRDLAFDAALDAALSLAEMLSPESQTSEGRSRHS
jgi:hypothetical protein